MSDDVHGNNATTVMAIVRAIKPLLAGHGGGVQGAILAELLAIWLASHHPVIREEILRDLLATAKLLVPVCERELFGEKGFPTEGFL